MTLIRINLKMMKHPFRYIFNFQITVQNRYVHRIIRLANFSAFVIFILTIVLSLLFYFILHSPRAGIITAINACGYLAYYPIYKKYSFSRAILFVCFYYLIHLTFIVLFFASTKSGFHLYFILAGPLLHLLSINESNKCYSYHLSAFSFILFLLCELGSSRFSTLSLEFSEFRLLYFSSVSSVFILLLLINIVYRKEIEMRELRFNKKNKRLSRTVNQLSKEIIERKKNEEKLKSALQEVQTLSGLLPICASCKSIRDDKGYWKKIESYIETHTDAVFSHGLCPDCMKDLYPRQYSKIMEQDGKI